MSVALQTTVEQTTPLRQVADLRGQEARLRGARFDELAVVMRVGTDAQGNVRWLCICDCGRRAIRTTVHLRRNQRLAVHQACSLCTAEAVRGRSLDRLDRKRLFWLELWREHGRLWSPGAEDYLADLIRADLDFIPEDTDFTAPEVPELEDTDDAARTDQRLAYMFSLGPRPDKCWRCVDCGSRFDIGIACTRCVEPTCGACVAGEAHRCFSGTIDDDRAWTLRSCGRVLGEVTVERARQLELKALRKLRHPARSRLLKLHVSEDAIDRDLASSTLRAARQSRSVQLEAEQRRLEERRVTRAMAPLPLVIQATCGARVVGQLLIDPVGYATLHGAGRHHGVGDALVRFAAEHVVAAGFQPKDVLTTSEQQLLARGVAVLEQLSPSHLSAPDQVVADWAAEILAERRSWAAAARKRKARR